MYEYRVTKYDPRMRDTSGAFSGDEWTCISDIGSEFDGRVLTLEEYAQVEDAYVAAAVRFLEEAGVTSLWVRDLEDHRNSNVDDQRLLYQLPGEAPGSKSLTWKRRNGRSLRTRLELEGAQLQGLQLEAAFRAVLRAEFWCRFEDDYGAFVHFGYDYYMYIGVPEKCEDACAFAASVGLFVEDFLSPHHPDRRVD